MKWLLWSIFEFSALVGTGLIAYFHDSKILAAGIIGFAIKGLIEGVKQIIKGDKRK